MIRKSFENQILNNLAISQEVFPVSYTLVLKQLVEAIANDFESLTSAYEGWEIADALIVIDRLASLEFSLATRAEVV